jgi:lambda family phage tail tape measure protein
MTSKTLADVEIKMSVDASSAVGGMKKVADQAKETSEQIGPVMEKASKQAVRGIDALIKKIEAQNAAYGKSKREIELAAQASKGANAAQLASLDAALRAQEVHKAAAKTQREAAQTARTAASAQVAAQAQVTAAAERTAVAQAKAAAAARKGTSGYFTLAAGQKLSAYQAQQLSFQLNDLFVQIASGQSPITALIQQGSQLNGQFGGITGTMRALGQAFRGLVSAIISPIGAIVAVAAAIASIGFFYAKGAQESATFRTQLALTGNAAGITEGQFRAAAQAISDSTDTTIRGTRETLLALASSGKFSGGALEGAARATQNLSKVTGEESKQIADDFIRLAGDVGKGAEDLNSKYNFLTATQLRYIQTLADQGQGQKALTILFEELNGRINTAATNLGYLERAWQNVKNAASGAVNFAFSIGAPGVVEDKVAGLKKQLQDLEGGKTINRNLNPTGYEREKAALTGQLEAMKEVERLGLRSALQQAERVQLQRSETAFFKLEDQFATNKLKREKEIANVKALAADGKISPDRVKKLISNINEKYKDPKGPKGTERADARAALLLQIEDIKSAGAAIVDAFSNQERLLEARKAASLLTDKEYYAEKKRLADSGSQAQIDVLLKENALLEKQKLNTKDGLDRDREVLKNKAEIFKLQAANATQVEILATQETAAYKKIADAVTEARIAAQSYFDLTQRGYEEEISNAGRGDKARDTDRAIAQIRQKYEAQRQALAGERRRNQITQQQHDDELAIINEFQTKAVDSYRDHYDRLDELQRDWATGANKALQNYFDQTQDTAKQTEDLFTNAFKGMEDALVDFVVKGKLNFKSLADSIVADIIRIAVRQSITGPLAQSAQGSTGFGGFLSSILGGLTGGGFTAGGTQGLSWSYPKAGGGYAPSNSIQRVNERGPELLNVAGRQYLMMGSKGGDVTPNSSISSGGGSRQTVLHYHASPGESRASANQRMADGARILSAAGARNN